LRRSFSLLLDDGLHKLFGVADLLEHDGDVERGSPRHPRALAVDAVLADHRERVGEQIERHGEPSASRSHHRFVHFECLPVLVQRAHHQPFFGGRAGRISTRLGRLREGWARRSVTTSATSSGASFQSWPLSC